MARQNYAPLLIDSTLHLLEAENVPVGVLILSGPKYHITFINPVICQLWGRTKKQAINKNLYDVLPELKGQGFEKLLKGVYTTGVPYFGKSVPAKLKRNGNIEQTYVDFVYNPIFGHNGKIVGIMVIATDATDREETITQLAESERKYKVLADNSDDLIAIITPEGIIEYASPSHYKILGYNPAQIENHSIIDVIHPSHVPTVGAGLAALLKTKKNVRADLQLKQSSGEWLWVEVNLSLLQNTAVKDKHILVAARDITFRKKAEESLRLAHLEADMERTKLMRLLKNVPALIATTRGPQHVIEFANPLYLKVLGKTEAILGKTAREAFPELEGQAIFTILDTVYKTGIPFEGNEVKFELDVRGNGELETFYLNFVYQVLRDKNDTIDGIFAHAVDVTEQVLARKKIEESEEKFRAMADNLPNLAWMADADGNIFWYNSRWYEYTGKTEAQMKGWGWQSVHDKKTLPEVLHRWKHSLKTKEPFEMIFPLRGKDKKYRYFLTRVVPVTNTSGEVVRWFGSNTDITEQKHIDEALKISEEQFRSTFYQSAVAIAMVDLKLRWINMNDVYPNMFGYTKAELLEKSFKDITHPDDVANDLMQVKRMLAKEIPSYNTEKRYIHKDGSTVWGLVHAAVVRDEHGVAKYITSVVQDITERKRLEMQKDEFMGIASHELKTPVTSIKAYGQVLESLFRKKGDSDAATFLFKMDQQINRLQSLIEDLLDVTKIESGKLQMHRNLFDVTDLVHDRVEEMQRISQKHTLICRSKGTHEVFADRERIGQVIINFISNAIKYSPTASKIVITCEQKKDVVVVSVKDYGVGIPKEHIPKLFDQFYRVSGPHENTYPGLGLGLYISSEIIKRSGGNIWCVSIPGKGSTFSFSLPLHAVKK